MSPLYGEMSGTGICKWRMGGWWWEMEKQEWGMGSREAETEREEWRKNYLMIESMEVRGLYTTTNILKNTHGTYFSTSRNTCSRLLSSLPLPRRDSLCFSISTFNLCLCPNHPPTHTHARMHRREDESSIKIIDQNNHRATDRTRQKKRERRSRCLLPNPPNLPESCTSNLLHKVLINSDLGVNLEQAHQVIM